MVKIYLKPEVCILLALLLITLPLTWLLSAILAALIHELCHLLVARCWGGTVTTVCIGWNGTHIGAEIPDRKGAILSIMAGPLGSLLLLFLYSWQPRLAICGLFQGIYNLLPIRPLDGGNLLVLFLTEHCPERGESVQSVIEGVTVLVLCVAVVRLVWDWRGILAVLFLVWCWLGRKIPCKRK